jgi:DNA-binding response OmpR family regulator
LAQILVVDDELGFREALHHTFTRRGHRVVTAMNTDHAANLMTSQVFDLIILDVMMPGELGPDLLKRIRASGNRVPVVIYSVKVDAPLEKEMRQAGANEVLHKSVSLEVLADRAEKVLTNAGKPATAEFSGVKKRLLVVDDEKSIRQMLVLFFGKKGYEVAEAASGEEALVKITEQKPDIILLDMNMGGMNGIDTLREILKVHPTLGVVMATGNEDDEKVRQAMEIGAYGYVLKPFDFLYLELVVISKLTLAGSSS